MPSDHTRSAILSAAERLYADRGFGDVTLRDIVAAAGVNLAAVNYHFGSKDELIAELFVTRSIATNRERLNELKAAEAEGRHRRDPARAGRPDAAWLSRPRPRALDRGAFHDPGLDRIGAADPPHQEP
jgi:AcrR family transcriptional regulator